jgi:lysozyme
MMSDNSATLLAELTRDEGSRSKPYRDTVGKLTVGVGRNLDDVGLRDDEIAYLLSNDVSRVVEALDSALPWWKQLDDVRQRVLVNMAFNMGVKGLLGFRNTLAAVAAPDYKAAAAGMLASKWAKQVGARAVRLAYMMEHGKVAE